MFLSDFLLVVVVGGGGGGYIFGPSYKLRGGGVLDIDIFWRGDICNMSYLVSLMLSFRDSAQFEFFIFLQIHRRFK